MDGANDQFANTLRAIREKKPVPEIDFSLHTMEDGTQVSTQERVCKGAGRSAPSLCINVLLAVQKFKRRLLIHQLMSNFGLLMTAPNQTLPS